MTDKQDLIREIHEYVTTHGGESTATHLLVQAASAIQTQAAELEAVGAGGVQAGAVPQRWKAVPVNPTPEMWKAAKTVPDPNPPYPPHYGLVWDAMLAASPTPPAEQQAQPGAVGRTGCTAGTDEECTRRGCATSCPAQQAAARAAPEAFLKSVIALCSHRGYSPANIETWDKDDKWIADLWRQAEAMLAASPTPPAEQAAPKAAPGEQNAVSAEWLEQAYREGWAACRDAETIGEEAEDWAFGNSTANSRMIDAQQAAPQQEVQEPALFVSAKQLAALTDPDDPDGEHGRYLPVRKTTKGLFTQALYTAPQPAPAPLSDDVVKDAARWRWLSEHIGVAWNEGKFTSLVRIVSDKNRTALNASIDRMMTGDWSDAALAAQGGK